MELCVMWIKIIVKKNSHISFIWIFETKWMEKIKIKIKISSQVLKPVTPGSKFLSNTRVKLIRCKLGTRQIPAFGGRAGAPGDPPCHPPFLPGFSWTFPVPFSANPSRHSASFVCFRTFFDGVFLSDLRARNPTIRVFVVIFFWWFEKLDVEDFCVWWF